MKKKLILIEFIVFLILTLIIGRNHEPWTDEAQSWLIARDSSVWEILWDISRYEGCFPLWYLILKLFITCGLEYKYLYIVPIVFSSLGVLLFIHSDKVPVYIKILLPFSYYIFYQYTIIARNYNLLFLTFSLLLITYHTRFDKPYKYILNLILFSFISMHGMVISGVLGMIYFYEVITRKKYKNLYSMVLLGAIWIIEIILLIPRNDLYITVNALYNNFIIVLNIFEDVVIYQSKNTYLVQNIISFLLFLIVTIYSGLCKKNRTFLIAELALFLFFVIIRANTHHFGIFYLLVIFGIILNYDKIMLKNKYFEKIILVMLVVYSIYSIQASYNDFNYKYCGSKQMAEYIEKNVDYENSKIYAIDYYPIAILPYFDTNIFYDRTSTFYEWSKNNKMYYYFNNFDIYGDEWCEQILNESEYVLIDDRNYGIKNKIKSRVEESGLYELEYKTTGKVYYKNSFNASQGFLLYRKK